MGEVQHRAKCKKVCYTIVYIYACIYTKFGYTYVFIYSIYLYFYVYMHIFYVKYIIYL